MAQQPDFDDSIRAQERAALRDEMVARLHQKGLLTDGRDATDAELADLLSAIDQFESTVVNQGGDLFVDSLDSSQPDNPRFVLPHMHDDESISAYTRRVQEKMQQLQQG